MPKNVWQAKANDVLPNGTIVEAGDRVRWSDYEMARDPTVWGPDAESFKPSRWITDEGGLMKTDMVRLSLSLLFPFRFSCIGAICPARVTGLTADSL